VILAGVRSTTVTILAKVDTEQPAGAVIKILKTIACASITTAVLILLQTTNLASIMLGHAPRFGSVLRKTTNPYVWAGLSLFLLSSVACSAYTALYDVAQHQSGNSEYPFQTEQWTFTAVRILIPNILVRPCVSLCCW
jgi:hypothetical protein